MIELTIFLPRNSSRTSTQAIIVPITALITTMISEVITVSLIAETASGSVIASQKAPRPSSNERKTTAPSGISTMMLSQVRTTPRVSTSPPKGRLSLSFGGVATAVSAGGVIQMLVSPSTRAGRPGSGGCP